jgi:hypothetical protein
LCGCSTRSFRLGVIVLLLGLAGPSMAADAAQQVEVRISARKVVEPADGRVVLDEGDVVTIRWHSDESVHLHVHGYDLVAHVEPDRALAMPFEARATGRFPVTSHGFGGEMDAGGHHGRALLYIEVHPR